MDGQNESRTRVELHGLQQQVGLLLQSVQSLEQRVAGLQAGNERLLTENGRLQAENAQLREELRRCRQELQEYKDRDGQSPTERLDEAYSLRSEEQRQQQRAGSKRRRKQNSPRRGRRTTAEKIAEADREEDVFPAGVPPEDCSFDDSRVVTRVEDGRAVRVAYHLHRGPRGEKAVIPGSLGRCEFGLEIAVSLAFLVFVMRLSLDKARGLLTFFQKLTLSKSQVDALLNRLSQAWEPEFDRLCVLLANSAVVHADETGWSLNSVWALLSEHARVFLFGVPKDAATLWALLPKELFEGVLVSDDAAVYRDFNTARKCWAHLLRKAIRLTLLQPDSDVYRLFCDGLFELDRKACRLKADRRLSNITRAARTLLLEDDLWTLCERRFRDETEPATDLERDFRNLVHELLRLMEADELFTFVTHAAVPATNNEAERALRDTAADRKTARTNKTLRGARRRSVLTSVLESLRVRLESFSLASVLSEVERWRETGQSCFQQALTTLNLPPPEASPLNTLLPAA